MAVGLKLDGAMVDHDVPASEWLVHLVQRQLLARRPDVNEELPLRKRLLEVFLEPLDLLGEVLESFAGLWTFCIDRDLDRSGVELGANPSHHSQGIAGLEDHRFEVLLFVHENSFLRAI